MNEEDMQKAIVSQAVAALITKIENSYSFNSARDGSLAKAADKAAEKWMEQNLAKILSAMDFETVTRMATLKLIEKIASKIT